MICRLIKISSVAHTIGLVWRHFDCVTSKWFCIEEASLVPRPSIMRREGLVSTARPNKLGACRACLGRASRRGGSNLLETCLPGLRSLCAPFEPLDCSVIYAIVPAKLPCFLYERKTTCQCASTVSGLLPSPLRALYLCLLRANRTSLSSAVSQCSSCMLYALCICRHLQ